MSRHRVIVRITPLGYAVLSGLVVVLLLGIVLIALAINRQTTKDPDRKNGTATTETEAPVEDQEPSAIRSVSAGSNYVAPASSVSITLLPQIETPTPEPLLTTTPSPTPPPPVINGVTAPTAAQVKFAVDGRLTGNGIAFRKGPATSYAILDKYNEGTVLKIFGIEGDYYFCQIVSEGERYGYFASKFVTKFGPLVTETEATPTPAQPRGTYQGIVIADKGVALRTMPSTSGNTPIGECAKGDAMVVYFQTGDFYYIEVVATGLKAYAYAAFISVNGSVPQGTPVP